jgi:hypothetical protein
MVGWCLAPMDRHLPFGATLAFQSSGRVKSSTALLIIQPNLAALYLARRNSRAQGVVGAKQMQPPDPREIFRPWNYGHLDRHANDGRSMPRFVALRKCLI